MKIFRCSLQVILVGLIALGSIAANARTAELNLACTSIEIRAVSGEDLPDEPMEFGHISAVKMGGFSSGLLVSRDEASFDALASISITNAAQFENRLMKRRYDTAGPSFKILAVGPELGTTDSRAISLNGECVGDEVRLTARVTRSGYVDPMVRGNLSWRPFVEIISVERDSGQST